MALDSRPIEARMRDSLIQVLNAEIDRLKEELIAESVKQFESELRDKVGRTAISVLDYVEVQRAGANLVITVRHVAESR